nr:MAG TPA: hypothetical protein [Caudoviricetes sp.]
MAKMEFIWFYYNCTIINKSNFIWLAFNFARY